MRKGRDREISRRASIRLSRSAKAPITCVHNVEILTCFGWMATRFSSARRAPVRRTTCGSERGRGGGGDRYEKRPHFASPCARRAESTKLCHLSWNSQGRAAPLPVTRLPPSTVPLKFYGRNFVRGQSGEQLEVLRMIGEFDGFQDVSSCKYSVFVNFGVVVLFVRGTTSKLSMSKHKWDTCLSRSKNLNTLFEQKKMILFVIIYGFLKKWTVLILYLSFDISCIDLSKLQFYYY